MLLGASLFAASGWIFSLRALEGLPPFFFIGTRFLVAGVLIGVLGGLRSVRLADLRASLPGAVALGLSMMAWITGLRHTSNPGVAAFISGCGNFIMPVFGLILYRWPVGRRVWQCLGIALVGLALLFLNGSARVEISNLWFVLASALWGLGMVISRRGVGTIGLVALTALQIGLSGLLMLACSAAVETWPTELPDGRVLLAFLGAVLVATCGRFLLQFKGQHMIPVGRAAIFLTLEPVWTLVASMTLLGTPLTGLQLAGCLVIFSAMLFALLPARPAAEGTS